MPEWYVFTDARALGQCGGRSSRLLWMAERISISRDRRTDGTREPGSWRPLENREGRSAMVTCARCERSASLTGHTIAANGEVSPSLQCPYKGCSWHVYVTLVGW